MPNTTRIPPRIPTHHLRQLRPHGRRLCTTPPIHAQALRQPLAVPIAPFAELQDQRTTAPPRTIAKCPPPTIAHARQPPDLDIDRKLPLLGSMPAHHGHVLVPTGRTDWKSRVEEDEAGQEGGIIRGLKDMMGPKGVFANPFHNIMITASSHPPPSTSSNNTPSFSALLFPAFRHITKIPTTSAAMADFLRAFVLPETVDTRAGSGEARAKLTRRPELARKFEEDGTVAEIRDVTVLVCGHGARDCRCGALGPVLAQEFEYKLNQSSFPLRPTAPQVEFPAAESADIRSSVAQISHIGGHKFAGNVIVYIPRALEGHPLAGTGIWYGRVEPKHVEGIVKTTIEEGIVIEELLRGGIGKDGEMLRFG